MKRYAINTDRTVNQLTQQFFCGRRFSLFLQSLLYPLQTWNNDLTVFAKEKQIEARMTSQVMWFEWFLTHKIKDYLLVPESMVTIVDTKSKGTDIYFESSLVGKPFTVWFQGEVVNVVDASENPRPLYLHSEEGAAGKASFEVIIPAIKSTITASEVVYIITYWVNLYKLAGKTYIINLLSE